MYKFRDLSFFIFIILLSSIILKASDDKLTEDQKWISENYLDLKKANSPTVYGVRVSMDQDLVYGRAAGSYGDLFKDKQLSGSPGLLGEFYYDVWQINLKYTSFGYSAGIMLREYGSDFNSGFFFNIGSTGDVELAKNYPYKLSSFDPKKYNGFKHENTSGTLYEFGVHLETPLTDAADLYFTFGNMFGIVDFKSESSVYYQLDMSVYYKFKFAGTTDAIGIGPYIGYIPYDYKTNKDYDGTDLLTTELAVPASGIKIYLQTGIHFLDY